MTIRPRAARLLGVTAALSLALTACGGDSATDQPDGQADQSVDEQETPVTSALCTTADPDCEDTIEDGVTDPAAGSCLADDEDCTDESYAGDDVARPIPLTDSPSDAERIARGATSGATGRPVTAAHLITDTTVELTFEGGACDLLEDVVVEESPGEGGEGGERGQGGEGGEVRVLVLTGMDAEVDMCTQQIVQWSIEVELQAPLSDRQLLDLAGARAG